MLGGQICLCVALFLAEKGNTNSQEISGKCRDSPGIIPEESREQLVYVFACLLVFSGPKYQ